MHIVSREYLTGVNRWFRNRTFAATVAGLPKVPIPLHLLKAVGVALNRLFVPANQKGAEERMVRALSAGADWASVLASLTAELQFLSSEFIGSRVAKKMPTDDSAEVALECGEGSLAEA